MKYTRLLVLLCGFTGFVCLGQTPTQFPIPKPVNFSALVTLAPGGSATLGFVLQQNGPNNPLEGSAPPSQWYLIRAVGPSLSQFGIKNAAQQPNLQLTPVTGENIDIISLYPIDWSATFAEVGAFPLTGGEQAFTSYQCFLLTSGVFTVQVTDNSGKCGVVLVEVYLLPGPVYNYQGPS